MYDVRVIKGDDNIKVEFVPKLCGGGHKHSKPGDDLHPETKHERKEEEVEEIQKQTLSISSVSQSLVELVKECQNQYLSGAKELKTLLETYIAPNKWLVSAGDDKTLRLWKLHNQNHQLDPYLLWTTLPFLDASGANLEGIKGISPFNLKLLAQNGAKTSAKDDEKREEFN